MRVAIMGSGGLGALIGGVHARGGDDVSFVARGANLQALRERGLTVQLNSENFHLESVRATDQPDEIGPVDLVWFCVKTYDVAVAARQLLPLIGPHTMVLPLQNGIEAAGQVGEVVGLEHVIGAINLGGGTLLSPGVVAAKGKSTGVTLGELQGSRSERVEVLAKALTGVGIQTTVKDDINIELWDKFVAACLTLGLCALTRLSIGPILAEPMLSEMGLGLMREVALVAKASGVNLPAGTPERWMSYLHERVAANPEVAGSMLYDILQERRLELEAMNGAVVRLGRQLGVETPLNFATYAALLPYKDGARASGQI